MEANPTASELFWRASEAYVRWRKRKRMRTQIPSSCISTVLTSGYDTIITLNNCSGTLARYRFSDRLVRLKLLAKESAQLKALDKLNIGAKLRLIRNSQTNNHTGNVHTSR